MQPSLERALAQGDTECVELKGEHGGWVPTRYNHLVWSQLRGEAGTIKIEELTKTLEDLTMELLTRSPFPLGYVDYSSEGKFDPLVSLSEFESLTEQELITPCYFRCVALARLPTIIQTGIDVGPSDKHIFVDIFPDKAWEYGGPSKVMLLLATGHLERTYKEVSANTPQQELADLRSIYPTMLPSKDGELLWLSRLPQDDPRISEPDEWQYARWIPGDPFKALQAVLIFGQSGGDTRNRVLEILGSITN